MRAWPLFAQPRPLACLVFLVIACDLVLAVAGGLVTRIRLEEVCTAAALVTCGVVCVEAMRRLGMPGGVVRDLLGAWWIPMLLLLPPFYSLIVPIPIYVMLQLRIRRAVVFRRVFSVASVALAGFTASTAFHAIVTGEVVLLDGVSGITEQSVLISGPGLLAAVLCCALFSVLNTALVAGAVRLSARETPRRRLIWDREAILLDWAELCVGLTVAILCGLSLYLLALVLPPVLLLQRSLLFQQLQTAARTDPKTGLLNAATWEREAEAELVRAMRSGRPLAVLIIDIDHFKGVNDTYGHLFGDQVLLGVATTLTHQLRQYDVVGRFGGEEFVVLLPGADMAETCRIAERLRSRVGRMALPVDETTVTVTISVGAALLRVHGRDLIELLAAADLALYRAKDSGRNRVCLPVSGMPDFTERPAGRPGGGGRTAPAAE
ncbi:diguanylate cyclase (GGDEF)-like protein [Spinactinospora alkalitolerans]|uniref:Diguanylate cyclase (GGDEF)-like protein n=2 Tax=Spinactinospora alkalitolerans TaxID=687207 RepID=A0A852TWQ5_9ACTN|nr:GGDEF domain-containing protein [Spinactinospora alkalitolerans]NYE46290.1 diguanylate cyclase (GGDEF)-like protein [Spinactinospora alkalitolerans]